MHPSPDPGETFSIRKIIPSSSLPRQETPRQQRAPQTRGGGAQKRGVQTQKRARRGLKAEMRRAAPSPSPRAVSDSPEPRDESAKKDCA